MRISIVLLAAAFSISCFENPEGPSGNTNVNQNVNVNINPSSNPSDNPSGDGSLPVGSTVRVGIFGPDCPSGVTPPNNGSGQIRVSCRGSAITATPKDANGNDLPPTTHGSDIAWIFSPGITCTQEFLGNKFNVFCSCPTAGLSFSVAARVKNVTGTLNGSCVA